MNTVTKIPAQFKVALVEDQQQFREFLQGELQEHSLEFHLDVFSSAEELLRGYRPGMFDLILVDLVLRDMGGVELIQVLAAKHQEYRCVVISSLLSEAQILEALKAGAIGYLQKFEITHITEDLRIFRDGGSVISPSIAAKLLPHFRKDLPSGWENLSNRERQILSELTNGLSPEEIAKIFQVSVHTIRTQIRSIYRKFQVSSRFQLMKKLNKL